jgi:hypothetical protein
MLSCEECRCVSEDARDLIAHVVEDWEEPEMALRRGLLPDLRRA